MANDDFQITATTQPAMTKIGYLALARLIVAHIKRGLDRDTWVLVGGKAVPRAMLHFYESNGTMGMEEPCESGATPDTARAKSKP